MREAPDGASQTLLVLACGNPSRGDDALGPELIERLRGWIAMRPDHPSARVELLWDFQLQIEHVLDLQGFERILFVDAAMQGPEPFAFIRAKPQPTPSLSTHSMTLAALLHLYVRVTGRTPPRAYQLAIRGHSFGLGRPLSERAAANLEQALAFVQRWIRRTRPHSGSHPQIPGPATAGCGTGVRKAGVDPCVAKRPRLRRGGG